MFKKNNVVHQDLENFGNKKLISKALNGELNLWEKMKFKKLLKINEWKNYHDKVQEMEKRVDNLLFTNNEKVNYQTLTKLGLPEKYQKLIDRKYSTESREIGFNIIDMVLGRTFILGFCALLLAVSGYMYLESTQWSREVIIASVSSVAVLTTYTLVSQS